MSDGPHWCCNAVSGKESLLSMLHSAIVTHPTVNLDQQHTSLGSTDPALDCRSAAGTLSHSQPQSLPAPARTVVARQVWLWP
jgi:hypothetical protein